MGVTAASVALPLRRLPGKQAREAGLADRFEALRVPWFDEDALTLAVDAGLALGDAVDRAERVVLALAGGHDQPGLVGHALDLDAPLAVREGPLAGLEALAAPTDAPTLVLSGGAGAGGAGAALMLEPGEGAPVEDASRATASTPGDPTGVLHEAVDALPDEGEVRAPASAPGRGSLDAPDALTLVVGEAGPAGPLVELAEALENGEAARVADAADGRALAVGVGAGGAPVTRTPADSVDVTGEAVANLDAETVPWHEASQGAYVSREDYEADPRERYGARALGAGEVAAATTIRGGPPGEFQRQHEAGGAYDVVVVDDGATRRIHQSTAPPGSLAIGDTVERALRRLFRQEGRWRYAVKVRPA